VQIHDKSWCDRERGTHSHSATCTPNSVEGLGRVRSLGGHEAPWPWRKLAALTSEGFLLRCHSGHHSCMRGVLRVGGIAEGRHSQIAPRTLGCRLLWRISARSLSMSPEWRLRDPKAFGRSRVRNTACYSCLSFLACSSRPQEGKGRTGRASSSCAQQMNKLKTAKGVGTKKG